MFAKGCNAMMAGLELNNGVAALKTPVAGQPAGLNVFFDSLQHDLVNIVTSGSCTDPNVLADGDEILLKKADCHITKVDTIFTSVVTAPGKFIKIPLKVTTLPDKSPYTTTPRGANWGSADPKGRVEIFYDDVKYHHDTLIYIPTRDPIASGLDSIKYYVQCGSNLDSGIIYIFIYKTVAGEY
jgi:hypothetical protein